MSKRRVFTWTCGATFSVRKKPGDPTRIQYRTPAENWASDEAGWCSGGTINQLKRFLAGEASYGYCGLCRIDGGKLVRKDPRGVHFNSKIDEKTRILTDVYRYVRRIR